MTPGAQAAALLFTLRLDLSRYRHARYEAAGHEYRRLSTVVEADQSEKVSTHQVTTP